MRYKTSSDETLKIRDLQTSKYPKHSEERYKQRNDPYGFIDNEHYG